MMTTDLSDRGTNLQIGVEASATAAMAANSAGQTAQD